MSRGDLSLTLHIILRTSVETARLFAQISFDAGERAVLAPLGRLILVDRPICGHLHVSQRDRDSIYCPFHAATSFAAVKSAQATTPTTVSVERNEVILCLTVLYNRRRRGLPESDRFEPQQLIRRQLREAGASIIQRVTKGAWLPARVKNKNALG